MAIDVESLAGTAMGAVKAARDLETLNNLRQQYLGRKGELTTALRSLGELPPAERPQAGERLNALRQALDEALQRRPRNSDGPKRKSVWRPSGWMCYCPGGVRGWATAIRCGPSGTRSRRSSSAWGSPLPRGRRSSSTTTISRRSIFRRNIRPGTCRIPFTSTPRVLLRTHTSPVQVRTMQAVCPAPVRIIAPGRVYRSDYPDASHSPMFHQVEGLVVGEGITFADLKGTLTAFVRAMYGPERARLLPAQLLPLHRTERGGLHLLYLRRRLPCLQEHRLAGDPGLGRGPSERPADVRLRPGKVQRFRLRDGHRADRDAEIRDRGHEVASSRTTCVSWRNSRAKGKIGVKWTGLTGLL